MRILAIGDPHGNLEKVKKIPLKDIDLILLTGDLGNADLMRKQAFANIERRNKGLPEIEFSSQEEKKAFMQAYDSSLRVVKYLSKSAKVMTIYGNVESSNPHTRKYSKELRLPLPLLTNALQDMKDVRVINNRIANAQGIKIGGLEYFIDDCWVKTFKPNNYSERLRVARKDTAHAAHILKWFGETDILVCHQPPYGILDKVTSSHAPVHWKGKHAGSKVISDYILKAQPKYVFCGHIHEGEGHKKIGKTHVYNLGVCGYQVINL